jgi:hypothetical protein
MDNDLLIYYLQEGIEIAEHSMTITTESLFPQHKKRCRKFIIGAKELMKGLTS